MTPASVTTARLLRRCGWLDPNVRAVLGETLEAEIERHRTEAAHLERGRCAAVLSNKALLYMHGCSAESSAIYGAILAARDAVLGRVGP